MRPGHALRGSAYSGLIRSPRPKVLGFASVEDLRAILTARSEFASAPSGTRGRKSAQTRLVVWSWCRNCPWRAFFAPSPARQRDWCTYSPAPPPPTGDGEAEPVDPEPVDPEPVDPE